MLLWKALGSWRAGVSARYVGGHRGLVGDLTVDAAGCVLTYPDLAQRVSP
ncbi:MAG: putative glycolipid-binding domain-containing protein [Actinomycetota bacterium]|nr:putative glycolipid-binding domain-containing protein [Actinomycetota bacterium]